MKYGYGVDGRLGEVEVCLEKVNGMVNCGLYNVLVQYSSLPL